MHAQHQDRNFWLGFLNLFQHLQPAPPRHRNVENDDVPALFPDPVEHFLAVAGFAELSSFELVGENLF